MFLLKRLLKSLRLLTPGSVSNADDVPKPPLVKEPEPRVELLRRGKADQDARAALTKWMKDVGKNEVVDEATLRRLWMQLERRSKQLAESLQRTDKENTDRLGKIVERYR